MQFDDRLATVLRHRAGGDRAARAQFRQLLDLLGARRDGFDRGLTSAAWLRLGALGEIVPASDRAAMIRDRGWRFRNPELAAHLAEDEPEVAAAALARADLETDDWEALIPRLPVRARGFLRLRRDLPSRVIELLETLGIHDRGLPDPGAGVQPDAAPRPVQQAEEAELLELTVPANDSGDEDDDQETAIGALVRRIEAFQRARAEGQTTDRAPRLPLGEQGEGDMPPLRGFAFTTDATGRIDWAEPAVASMVVGTRLSSPQARTALQRWQRLENARMHLRGAPQIAGEWIVDAAPRFTAQTGRFYGLAGKFRRPAARPAATDAGDTGGEADRIRQLLHELRTPVNAIQGFAEVIQQQLFGEVPHEYRALAANIAGDAARMLAGFDELDRLARIETGALEPLAGDCDFALLCRALAKQLEAVLAPRLSGFVLDIPAAPAIVPLALREGEALAWRLLATLASSLGTGETVELTMRVERGVVLLSATLPATLGAEEDVFATHPRAPQGGLSAGMFGAGFALRLVRAEAGLVGGAFERVDDTVQLALPLLTAPGRDSSPAESREPERHPEAR
ncbi:histidine kinase dimerization/phospho-acceptor domain-containing protein [Pelagerythrobacter marensis]|uniref:histidine kinase n=1 Tax=Pelagerythrobacter marensis TaxID=543877 RepID=A0A0G3X812_9SPHN|nr:histidine kinase dimerization/phospho-acceptor domain-containing protein [Pelagerythrobacter marensis]AKM06761.1 Two-component signal transduction histidine kinase [Pelagerythrobacter marensis]